MAYYLRYHNSNYCFDSYYINSSGQVVFHDLLRNVDKSFNADLNSIKSGFVFTDGKCEYNQTLQKMGIDYYHYNFLVGLDGVLFGFVVFFVLSLLFISYTRRV